MPAKYTATSWKNILTPSATLQKIYLFIIVNPEPEVLTQNSEQTYYYQEKMHYIICISKSVI